MAKKSQRRGLNAKTIPVVEDVVVYEDGGIYWHEKKIHEKRYLISPAEQANILSKLDDHAGQLAAELARVEADDLPRGQNGNEHEQADAYDAAYLIRELRAIVEHGGDCDALLVVYRLGRQVERMQVRPFGNRILGKKKSDRALNAVNVAKKSRSASLKDDALAAIEQAKLNFPTRDTEITFLKKKAAASLGIEIGALNKRLRG